MFVCSGGRKLLHVAKRSLESGDIQVVQAGELNAYIAGGEAMPASSEGNLFVSCCICVKVCVCTCMCVCASTPFCMAKGTLFKGVVVVVVVVV